MSAQSLHETISQPPLIPASNRVEVPHQAFNMLPYLPQMYRTFIINMIKLNGIKRPKITRPLGHWINWIAVFEHEANRFRFSVLKIFGDADSDAPWHFSESVLRKPCILGSAGRCVSGKSSSWMERKAGQIIELNDGIFQQAMFKNTGGECIICVHRSVSGFVEWTSIVFPIKIATSERNVLPFQVSVKSAFQSSSPYLSW